MFRRIFGLPQPAADNSDQDPDPETPDDDGDQDPNAGVPDDDGDQDPDPEDPEEDGDQDLDPEDPDDDGDQDAEMPDDDGDQDPDAEDPDDDDDDQSDSSDDSDYQDSDDSDGPWCHTHGTTESPGATPPYYTNEIGYPLLPPESDHSDTEWPGYPPEEIFPDYEYPSREGPSQDDLYGDEDPPEEPPLQEDPSEEEPPQEEPSGADIISLHSSDEDGESDDAPQEGPSGVDIISLHSSDDDDDDESDRDEPVPPDDNPHAGFQPVQCDWIPRVNGNYPGPGQEGVRCQNMSAPQGLQVLPCDRGNNPLHANGGIRNICDEHRAKVIFEDAYLAWWRHFRPVYCKPHSLQRTRDHAGRAFTPCTCPQNCYSIWRCMECSEDIRQPLRDGTLIPARAALLARVRRRVRGRWVYQRVANGRTRMACPSQGCYRRPWLRYHGHVVDNQGGFGRESAPIGNVDAWYHCLGCARDIKIPPSEDPAVAVFNPASGDIVTPRARQVFPRIR